MGKNTVNITLSLRNAEMLAKLEELAEKAIEEGQARSRNDFMIKQIFPIFPNGSNGSKLEEFAFKQLSRQFYSLFSAIFKRFSEDDEIDIDEWNEAVQKHLDFKLFEAVKEELK
jgi:hypothetical protein